jgi:hypothetical protein
MEVTLRLVSPSWRRTMLSGTPSCGRVRRVGVAQLVGREPSPHRCLRGDAAELCAGGVACPGPPTGWPVDHAQQRADRQPDAELEPGADRTGVVIHGHGRHSPDATLPPSKSGSCEPGADSKRSTRMKAKVRSAAGRRVDVDLIYQRRGRMPGRRPPGGLLYQLETFIGRHDRAHRPGRRRLRLLR